MRPRTGSSDLRNTHLNPIRDMRGQMTSATPSEAEKANDEEELASLANRSADLDHNRKHRDVVMARLRASLKGTNQQRNESSDDGEVEHSDTSEDRVEPDSLFEDEVTGVVYSETENADGTQLPGPSRQQQARTSDPGTLGKTNTKKISPIKFPTTQNTPRRSRTAVKQDLRVKLDKVPASTKPKLIGNVRPLASRLGAPGAPKPCPWSIWLPGCIPPCGTEHRHRPFIAGNNITNYEENPVNPENYDTGEDDEEIGRVSEDDVTTDEMGEDDFTNRQNKKQNKEQK